MERRKTLKAVVIYGVSALLALPLFGGEKADIRPVESPQTADASHNAEPAQPAPGRMRRIWNRLSGKKDGNAKVNETKTETKETPKTATTRSRKSAEASASKSSVAKTVSRASVPTTSGTMNQTPPAEVAKALPPTLLFNRQRAASGLLIDLAPPKSVDWTTLKSAPATTASDLKTGKVPVTPTIPVAQTKARIPTAGLAPEKQPELGPPTVASQTPRKSFVVKSLPSATTSESNTTGSRGVVIAPSTSVAPSATASPSTTGTTSTPANSTSLPMTVVTSESTSPQKTEIDGTMVETQDASNRRWSFSNWFGKSSRQAPRVVAASERDVTMPSTAPLLVSEGESKEVVTVQPVTPEPSMPTEVSERGTVVVETRPIVTENDASTTILGEVTPSYTSRRWGWGRWFGKSDPLPVVTSETIVSDSSVGSVSASREPAVAGRGVGIEQAPSPTKVTVLPPVTEAHPPVFAQNQLPTRPKLREPFGVQMVPAPEPPAPVAVAMPERATSNGVPVVNVGQPKHPGGSIAGALGNVLSRPDKGWSPAPSLSVVPATPAKSQESKSVASGVVSPKPIAPNPVVAPRVATLRTPAPRRVLKPLLNPIPVQQPYNPLVVEQCIAMLRHSRVEEDREKAMQMLASTSDWQWHPLAIPTIRQVVLNDYNTRMRLAGVQMLGAVRMESPVVAEALRISAQFDSEPTIRLVALSALERLASAPPEYFVR